MQHTLSALLYDGLADDAAVEAVVGVGRAPVALRLVMAAGACRCGGPGPTMVAIDPADAALPARQSDAVRGLRPGTALVDRSWAHLVGGQVALAGRSLVVSTAVDLSDSCGRCATPLVLTLGDLAASLAETDSAHLPVLTTVLIRRGSHQDDETVPTDWSVLGSGSPNVALEVGAAGAAHVSESAAHLPTHAVGRCAA